MGMRFIRWLPVGSLLILISGLVYAGLQQNYRATANDPQIQMAQDAAAALRSGKSAITAQTTAKVDVRQSLAPFIIAFDQNGREVASTAELDGQTPSLPPSVLKEITEKNGEIRFTWAPQPDVRIAAVIKRFDKPQPGYILAGRSLREVEQRIRMLGVAVGGFLLASLAITLLYFMVVPKKIVD